MFLQMLKDEFPDVRLHIISKLELVNKGKIHATAFFLEKKKEYTKNKGKYEKGSIVTATAKPLRRKWDMKCWIEFAWILIAERREIMVKKKKTTNKKKKEVN